MYYPRDFVLPRGALLSPTGRYVSRGWASCLRWRGCEVRPLALSLVVLLSFPVCQNVTQRSPCSDAVFHVKTLALTAKAVVLVALPQR